MKGTNRNLFIRKITASGRSISNGLIIDFQLTSSVAYPNRKGAVIRTIHTKDIRRISGGFILFLVCDGIVISFIELIKCRVYFWMISLFAWNWFSAWME